MVLISGWSFISDTRHAPERNVASLHESRLEKQSRF